VKKKKKTHQCEIVVGDGKQLLRKEDLQLLQFES
jgi:hypothetical protein